MKRAHLFILMFLFATVLFAESYQPMTGSDVSGAYRAYRPTTSDLYMRSYDLVLGSNAQSPVATQRSEEYKRQYEVCDADHNCIPLTSAAKPQVDDGKLEKKPVEISLTKPFLHAPTWL